MRNYFRTLDNWPVDMGVCVIIAFVATPADPMSVVLFLLPLVLVWMLVRWLIYRRLTR